MTITFYDKNENPIDTQFNVLEINIDNEENTIYWTTLGNYGDIKKT